MKNLCKLENNRTVMKRNEEDEKRKKEKFCVRKSRNRSNFREVGFLVWLRSTVIRDLSQRRIIERGESGCGVDSRATCACVPCEIAISSSDIITWSLLWLVDVSVCEACISIFWVIVFSVILFPYVRYLCWFFFFFSFYPSPRSGVTGWRRGQVVHIHVLYIPEGVGQGLVGSRYLFLLRLLLFSSFLFPPLFSLLLLVCLLSLASRTRPYLLYHIVCIYRI